MLYIVLMYKVYKNKCDRDIPGTEIHKYTIQSIYTSRLCCVIHMVSCIHMIYIERDMHMYRCMQGAYMLKSVYVYEYAYMCMYILICDCYRCLNMGFTIQVNICAEYLGILPRTRRVCQQPGPRLQAKGHVCWTNQSMHELIFCRDFNRWLSARLQPSICFIAYILRF